MTGFEWDEAKASSHREKHGVSFEQASVVFSDPKAITIDDPDHSIEEAREITVGKAAESIILMVSHTDRNGITRIISARKANAKERRRYEEY